MTTDNQNKWAQLLEDATQKEIRQMAEWAIEHITDADQIGLIRTCLEQQEWDLLQDVSSR